MTAVSSHGGGFRRARDARGAVALEFALVLVPLVTLLLGLVTAGLSYSHHLALTDAVREAARMGAAVDYTTAPTTPTVWADSVQERVQQVYMNGTGDLPLSRICVELTDSSGAVIPGAVPTSQGSDCGTAPPTPAAATSGSCLVKVWARRPEQITLGVLPDIGFSIGGQSVAYYGRGVGACSVL